MAQVPVTLQVVVYPKNKTDKPYPATIVGYAWITGLEVGGGPVIPEIPPEIKPPSGAHPSHPIWPPLEPHPEHPIELPPIDPPPPIDIPDPPNVVKPPPDEGGWAWGPNVGWIYVPGEGTPGPKRR